MKSITKISKQTERKFNPKLVETIKFAKNKDKWLEVASILSKPRKLRINLNLSEINERSKQGESVLISGKVLSQGDISKKLKVIALDFSKKAKEKLLSSNCEVFYILEEIKSNPEMKNIEILKK